MPVFVAAHAAHADPHRALADAAAQVRTQGAQAFAPTLGWLYFSDRFADHAEAILADAQRQWPGVSWIGGVAIGVAACGVEYFDQPALALMLSDLPRKDFTLFSGRAPLAEGIAFTAQVHADGATPDVDELVAEIAARTGSGMCFGGLVSSRGRSVHLADDVFEGGLSGVAFSERVGLVSRVTQGCQPLSAPRRVTAVDGHRILMLDGRPALPQLLADLHIRLDDPQTALPVLRSTLVGLTDADDAALWRGQFGDDTRIRHLIGLDPAHDAVAIAGHPAIGDQLTFCRRDREAARRDLVRICTEIREEVESAVAEPAMAAPAGEGTGRHIAGAVYVSCSGRGGPHFGAPSAELQIVRRALGELPLVGFFAAGEIAHHHLYGYTGVLTAFTATPGR